MSVTELVALDMAGTTVQDGGIVEQAVLDALELTSGVDSAGGEANVREFVRSTMGESKITCFRAMLGDEDAARRADVEFERAYGRLAGSIGLEPVDGAQALVDELCATGIKVCLTTGFSPRTRDLILDGLGWRGLADLVLSPTDVGGRGRPYPDMLLAAALRLELTDVRNLVVVGDTTSDLVAGTRAGAGEVVGVLTGAHDLATLSAAPHTRIVDSVADLRDVVCRA